MKKLTILSTLICILLTAKCLSQVVISADNASGSCNTLVTIPIKVSSFSNIIGMQGSINWDAGKLSFSGISYFGSPTLPLNSSNFGLTQTSTGKLSFSWNDINLAGVTLPNSTILFSLQFLTTATSSTSTTIQISNSPTVIEFIDIAFSSKTYIAHSGTVNINCSNPNCSINSIVPGINSGCNPQTNFYSQQLTVAFTNPPVNCQLKINGQSFPISGSPQTVILDSLVSNGLPVDINAYFTDNPNCQFNSTGLFVAPTACFPNEDTVLIYTPPLSSTCNSTLSAPVLINNFTNLVSFQGSISWDPTIITFNSINFGGPSTLALSPSNFGTTLVSQGKLTFSWNDPTLVGITLPISTTMFSILFDVTALSETIASITFGNSPAGLEFINLSYTPVNYIANNGSLFISCPDSNCHINNILTGSQSQCNPSTNFYSQELILEYSNPPTSGVININGQTFPIAGSPQTIVLENLISNGLPLNINAFFSSEPECQKNLPYLLTAPVACMPTGKELNLYFKSINDSCSSSLTVPIQVRNFNDINSMQGSIGWDPTVIDFYGITGWGPGVLSLTSNNFGLSQTSFGTLSFSWNDLSLSGVTLPDTTVLFEVGFNVLGSGGSSSELSFINLPTPLEFTDTTFNSIPYKADNAVFTELCQNGLSVFLTKSTQSGEGNAIIDVTAKDFENILSFQGSIAWEPDAYEYNGLIFNTANLLNLAMTNFGLEMMSVGNLTFSWFDSSLAGLSLSDNSVLFSIIFSRLKDTCTTFQFTDNPVSIEFVDTSMQPLTINAFPLTICKCETFHIDTHLICEGSTYAVGSSIYTLPGIYYDTLVSVTGCDSIIITHLGVTPISVDTVVINYVNGNNYLLPNDSIVTTPGFYTVILTSALACDSIIVFHLRTFASINGIVSYVNVQNSPITNSRVDLLVGNTTIASTFTNNQGYYSFDSIDYTGQITVEVTCTKQSGGYNAVDALLVAKHFAALTTLTGLPLIAADVNHSGFINSVDALFILRRFAALISEFPSGDWYFQNPTFFLLPNETVTKNIIGLCFGDVNTSFIPPSN